MYLQHWKMNYICLIVIPVNSQKKRKQTELEFRMTLQDFFHLSSKHNNFPDKYLHKY